MIPVLVWMLAGGGLLLSVATGRAGADRPVFSYPDYLVAPVRVHLLDAPDSRAIGTTLTEPDITRILRKINAIWSQAGIAFYLESLVREEAAHPELDSLLGHPNDLTLLLKLRPEASKASNVFHLYYVKQFSANGVYLGEAMFVKDTAALRAVPGGIDEPLPRVSSHELGHALSLRHHTNVLHLLASRTTGTHLDAAEIRQARQAAAGILWIQKATTIMEQADQLHAMGQTAEARKLYQMLAPISLDASSLRKARQRGG